jgi:glycosyltransferase involved in cell wall biosynthesis
MKIAVLSPSKFEEAPTFIQNHITNLPFEIVTIHGGDFPHLTDKQSVLNATTPYFKWSNVVRRVLRLKPISFKKYNLTKILKEEKVDLVFAEFLHSGAEVVEVCKELKIPLTAIALGYEVSRYKMLDKYHDKYKSLFQYAKTIFIVSQHMQPTLEKLGCPGNKIVCTPAGVASKFMNLTPDFTSKQLLSVGRFVDKKAPHLTILAFKKVLEFNPDAVLVMAGDGPLLSVCKDLVSALKIDNAVKFVGRITPSEHQVLLQESIAFVQHSRVAEDGDSEGTPVAILEASAAGLPIVSTHHAGIPNTVIDNMTGFLVPENDVDAMAEKMMKILENKELAKEMGARGKSFISEHFTLKQHISMLSKHIITP